MSYPAQDLRHWGRLLVRMAAGQGPYAGWRDLRVVAQLYADWYRPIPPGAPSLALHFRGQAAPFWVRRNRADYSGAVREIWEDGSYDPALAAPLPPGYVLDLGGFTGAATRRILASAGARRVIVVEPDLAAVGVLRRNCAPWEARGWVTIVAGAIAPQDGWVRLDSGVGPGQRRTQPVAAGTPGARRAYSIPGLLERQVSTAAAPIALLKCDIEGAEQALFATCAPWIRQVRRLVVEVHPPYAPGTLFADLHRNGGRFRLVAGRCPTPSTWVGTFFAED